MKWKSGWLDILGFHSRSVSEAAFCGLTLSMRGAAQNAWHDGRVTLLESARLGRLKRMCTEELVPESGAMG